MNTDLFLIGVDGGGTGTRIVLADAQGRELAQAASGPSGLGLGVKRAWRAIAAACADAFSQAGAAFRAQAPALAGLAVESDAYTTLLGAHAGACGVIVALGTGSVGAAADRDGGECRMVSGYGFPSGDEASGAWLGVRAIVHAQHALDGRGPNDDFAQALLAHVGARDRDELVAWLCE
ncbi:BadF/BadG/BcrA/BcrD ATPase family protein, partial [Burkholderia gladioli]|uniref:BadF/BadG/BcrA/BcrD ATPase family protein n=1 Tax=Burkholderia gladioli TaxID=28095 RepID=UPI0024459FBF